MRRGVTYIATLKKNKTIEKNSCVSQRMWYTNHMTTNNNNVSRAWVSDFTGIDYYRIEDFDIDKGMLKVEVAKDFNSDFEQCFADFLADYDGREYVFELPVVMTTDGKKDYDDLLNAGMTENPVIFMSEKLQRIY